jgi:hypothetical protein
MDVPNTYYSRNRERLLALAKQYYQDHKDHYQEYNKKYYQHSRKMERPPKPEKPKKTPAPKKTADKRKTPHDYFVYEQPKDPLEAELSSYNLKPHQVKRMMELCPLGIYQPPKADNPFLCVFK